MNAPSKLKRTSNESGATLSLKAAAVRRIALAGRYDLVKTEWFGADIAAITIDPFEVDCYEVESRNHPHVLTNIRRNFQHGATRTIVICLKDRVAQTISDRVGRELKEEEQANVSVTTLEGIYEYIRSTQ